MTDPGVAPVYSKATFKGENGDSFFTRFAPDSPSPPLLSKRLLLTLLSPTATYMAYIHPLVSTCHRAVYTPFSPAAMRNIKGEIVPAEPICANLPLRNSARVQGNIVLILRGEVSFDGERYSGAVITLWISQMEVLRWAGAR